MHVRSSRRLAPLAVAVASLFATHADAADALPMLGHQGVRMVDPAGKPVVLRGCNLGNYLILESWMFGGTIQDGGKNFEDQEKLYRRMRERFGADRTEELMDTFRASWITPRDFELVKSFGFNCVRLPFDYRLLEDDATPGTLRADAFQWTDHVLKMAEEAGVYVILDMHGVPGGQSKQDHTGESGQNKIWESEALQKRTIDLWKKLSERYKDRAIVAAYDLINEPYSDYKQDVRPHLAELMPKIADAIRATGDRHVIYYAGALNGGVAFYGKPKASNIAVTEHYYPGLFGSKPALETHARLLGQELPAKQAYLEKLGTPYLVGEFNPVLAAVDAPRMTRAYFDRFAEYGWAATLWSYKLLKPEAGAGASAWYMVTNGQTLPKLDVATATADDFEAFFRSLATSEIAVNEPLREAVTAKTPAPLYLAKYEPLPTAGPTTPSAEPAGFRSSDIGGATPGHTRVAADGTVEIMGGGTDINGTRDSFRFVSKAAREASETRATITQFVDSQEYAKAGPMARWGDAADSAMAMVNLFPDGTIALIHRASDGGPTTEKKVRAGVELPVQLKLAVKDGKATASYRSTRGGDWLPVGTADVPRAPDYRVGLAVCAHVDAVLTTVKAKFDAAGDAALPAELADTAPKGASLLKNGSFEAQGEQPNLAAGWSRWGDWIDRETAWSPTKEGKAVIGYHHWQIEGKGATAGLWQDAKVEPGKRYTFTIFAQHDAVEADKKDAKTIELRLEGVRPDGQITLNSQEFGVAHLATGDKWTKLSVSGTANAETIRVLAVINSSDEATRGGAIKLDAAMLTPATDGR